MLTASSDNLANALKLLSDALQVLSLRMSAVDPIRVQVTSAAMRAADFAANPMRGGDGLKAEEVCRLAAQVSGADARDPLECGAVATAIDLCLARMPSHV